MTLVERWSNTLSTSTALASTLPIHSTSKISKYYEPNPSSDLPRRDKPNHRLQTLRPPPHQHPRPDALIHTWMSPSARLKRLQHLVLTKITDVDHPSLTNHANLAPTSTAQLSITIPCFLDNHCIECEFDTSLIATRIQ